MLNRYRSRGRNSKRIVSQAMVTKYYIWSGSNNTIRAFRSIRRKGKHISHSLVVIGIDNRRVYKKIVNNVKKVSIFVQDTGAEIVQIRKLLRKN